MPDSPDSPASFAALAVVAIDLDTAKNVGIAVVVGLVVLAILAAWVLKTVAQKVALVVILGLLGVLVWSQRANLDECADRVKATAATGFTEDTECTFFFQDVSIDAPRNSVDTSS